MAKSTCYTAPELHLRALSKEDLPTLLRWENDPEALRTNEALNPLSEDFLARYIAASSQHILEVGSLGLIIEEKATKEALGHLNLYGYSPIHRRLALGLYIAPEHRRRGVARLALEQAIHYAFGRLRCEQVYAEVLADNHPPQQLLRQLGFNLCATLPRWCWVESSYQDLLYFQLWNK